MCVELKGFRIERHTVGFSCLGKTYQSIDNVFAHHLGIAVLRRIKPSAAWKLERDLLAGLQDVLGLGVRHLIHK